MAARQGQPQVPCLGARQRESTPPGRSLPNQTQRAKSSGEQAAGASPKRSNRRSHRAARGLSQGRGPRKNLLRSAGLLQTIHSAATIAAAKVLFVQLSQRFTDCFAARTTLAPKAGDRLQRTTRWPFVRHPKSTFSCHAYRCFQGTAYDSSEPSITDREQRVFKLWLRGRVPKA